MVSAFPCTNSPLLLLVPNISPNPAVFVALGFGVAEGGGREGGGLISFLGFGNIAANPDNPLPLAPRVNLGFFFAGSSCSD